MTSYIAICHAGGMVYQVYRTVKSAGAVLTKAIWQTALSDLSTPAVWDYWQFNCEPKII